MEGLEAYRRHSECMHQEIGSLCHSGSGALCLPAPGRKQQNIRQVKEDEGEGSKHGLWAWGSLDTGCVWAGSVRRESGYRA